MFDYWKSKLDYQSKIYYDKMLTAFRMQKERVECGEIAPERIEKIYSAILNDHPELFYLSYTPQIQQLTSIMSVTNSIKIRNIFDRKKIAYYNDGIQSVITSLDKELVSKVNEIDKELFICDYFIENTTYQINNIFNQNAATVLVEKQGQCSGIARAVKLLLNHYNIECIVIEGEGKDSTSGEKGPHAWNIVEIDGHYYHLDVTYMIGINRSKQKPFRYAYFNYSDDQISSDHLWDRSLVPQCKTEGKLPYIGDEADVFSYTHILSLYELKQALKAKINQGDKSFTFKSLIACRDTKELMLLVKSACQSVIDVLDITITLQISIQGDIVSLKW